MPSVFISYRRGDSPANARLLYDRLRGWFRESDVFMDVEEIRAGADWLAVLKDKTHACDVLIALIGPGWLAALDSSGLRRLDDPQDFVRYEIAEALRQSKRVIPVLVDGAMLPARNELPDDIASLAGLQALTIAHESFEKDAERLIEMLSGGVRTTDALQAIKKHIRLAKAAFVLAPAAAAAMLFLAWIALFDFLTLDSKLESYTMRLGDIFLPGRVSADIALVAIVPGARRFDRSFRSDYARLIDALSGAGAKLIAFDVFLKEQGPFDAELIAAIRRARAKGIPVVFGFNDVSEGKPVIAPGFADAVSGVGLLCVGTRLGYARLVPLVLNPREQKLAALSLLTAHGAGTIEEVRASEAGVRDAAGKTRWVGFSASHTVARPPNDCPAMPEGSEYAGLILRLSPLELLRAQRWPLDTVLTGSADQFKGKIVVVGVELPQDRIEVTRGLHREVRYGYELHADAVNNLLQGVSVRPLGTGAQFTLMLIMAALAGAIRLGAAPRARRWLAALACVGYLVAAVLLYAKLQLLLNTIYHLGAFFLTYWALGVLERRWSPWNTVRRSFPAA